MLGLAKIPAEKLILINEGLLEVLARGSSVLLSSAQKPTSSVVVSDETQGM